MVKWLIKSAKLFKTPSGVVLLVSLVAIALLVNAPAATAVGVKALAIVFVIALLPLMSKVYRWLFKR
jgi:hypothetical protein